MPSRAFERLEDECLVVSRCRVLGDDDLGAAVTVEIGDGELGDRPETVFVVEPDRPEQPAVAQ